MTRVRSSTVERRAFNPHDAGSTPVAPTELDVKELPTILQLEDFMPLIHSEANFLNDLCAEEREWMIGLQKEMDRRLDKLVLEGDGS